MTNTNAIGYDSVPAWTLKVPPAKGRLLEGEDSAAGNNECVRNRSWVTISHFGVHFQKIH